MRERPFLQAITPDLRPEQRQHLRHHVLLDFPDGRKAVVFGKTGRFLTDKEHAFFKTYRALGLVADNPDFDSFQYDTQEFNKFMAWASEHGWLCSQQDQSEAISGKDAVEVIEQALAMWQPTLLWHGLTESVFKHAAGAISFLLEKTWFIAQSSTYLSKGASTAEKTLKTSLIELEREERDHYKMLLPSLGITARDVEEYDADHATRLFVCHLIALASKSPMGLAISLNLLEADASNRDATVETYRKLEQLTGLSLEPFLNHFELDLQHNHAGLWHEILSSIDEVSPTDVSQWIDELHSTKHAIQIWQDGLKKSIDSIDPASFAGIPPARALLRRKPSLWSIVGNGERL